MSLVFALSTSLGWFTSGISSNPLSLKICSFLFGLWRWWKIQLNQALKSFSAVPNRRDYQKDNVKLMIAFMPKSVKFTFLASLAWTLKQNARICWRCTFHKIDRQRSQITNLSGTPFWFSRIVVSVALVPSRPFNWLFIRYKMRK